MTGPERQDPLDPAERALADALADTVGSHGPPPSIDAAILASARAAAAARAGVAAAGRAPSPRAGTGASAGGGASMRRRPRRGPRWLQGGALAATLVIAAGVAWQLRPQQDASEFMAPEADGPPPAAVRAPAAPPLAEAPAAPAVAVPALDDAPPTVAAEEAPAASAAPPTRPAATTAAPAAPDPTERPPPEAASMADMPAPAPPPPPPPAPPAPTVPAPASQAPAAARPAAPAAAMPETAARVRAEAARARQATAREAAPVDAAKAQDGEDWFDQPLDDTPPASVDAPVVREAWLSRIRELVAAERYDEARASFAEFRRRHPDAEVPADLRSLLGGE